MFEDEPRDEQDPAEETPAEEAPVEEAPAAEAPAEQTPAADADEPADDEPADDEPDAAVTPEEPPSEPTADVPEPAVEVDAPDPDEPATEAGAPAAEEPASERPPRGRASDKAGSEPEVIPGAHLEPDLVLDEAAAGDVGGRAGAEIQAAEESFAAESERLEGEPDAADVPAPVATTILDLAADARYQATGKRKRAVARVIIRPGSGVYLVNGRELNAFFPRPTLQLMARGPLETVGQQERMDVVAKIHGGGVSSQAAALRHGIARALVEADPNLRGELKRRGFLTRDPRVKERKKAGLKKARKRPQFSKR